MTHMHIGMKTENSEKRNAGTYWTAKRGGAHFRHRAQTREDFVRHIERNEWDHLLRRIPIKPGDFFYVPSGTLHALCEGTLVLEIQQSSDATYRLYDYDRTDGNGNKRELHLQKAIDVTSIPHTDENVKAQSIGSEMLLLQHLPKHLSFQFINGM